MKKWFDNGWIVAVACFIFPPLGIYALWKNTEIQKNNKIVFGLVALAWMLLPFFAQKDEKAVLKTGTSMKIDSSMAKTKSLYDSKEDSIKAYNEALKSVQSSNGLSERLSQIEILRGELSEIGIGELGSWNKPDENSEYMSITNYHEFGNENENLRRNNIALYLTSTVFNEIEKVELDMRVNNKLEEKKAVAYFTENSKKVLKILGLKYSENNQEKDGYKISTRVKKGNVNQYTLTIEKIE